MYIQKAERKGRTKAEVDEIIRWLTGYDENTLNTLIETGVDFETFLTTQKSTLTPTKLPGSLRHKG